MKKLHDGSHQEKSPCKGAFWNRAAYQKIGLLGGNRRETAVSTQCRCTSAEGFTEQVHEVYRVCY